MSWPQENDPDLTFTGVIRYQFLSILSNLNLKLPLAVQIINEFITKPQHLDIYGILKNDRNILPRNITYVFGQGLYLFIQTGEKSTYSRLRI